MPMLRGRWGSMSELPRAAAQLRERTEENRITGKKRDGMTDAGAETVHARPGQLKLEIVPRAHLRRVRLHGRGPGFNRFRRGDVDEHRRQIVRLAFDADSIKKELLDFVAGL